jgi:hypothetical protein
MPIASQSIDFVTRNANNPNEPSISFGLLADRIDFFTNANLQTLAAFGWSDKLANPAIENSPLRFVGLHLGDSLQETQQQLLPPADRAFLKNRSTNFNSPRL